MNIDSNLSLSQDGHPKIDHDASWETRPFEFPLYWALRVRWGRLALETLHHKVYLREPPPEIGFLSVSHGFNIVSVQRLGRIRSFHWLAGAGVVLAHPESEVRGMRFAEDGGLFDRGYHAAGPAFLAGVGKSLTLARRSFASLELRASVAPVSVPVEGGDARFTNFALHALAGLGFGSR